MVLFTRVAFPLLLLAFASGGCASSLHDPEAAQGAQFPSPGRTIFLKKSWDGTAILVCEGGPNDAVCYEKPN